jgi:hypothetical protein
MSLGPSTDTASYGSRRLGRSIVKIIDVTPASTNSYTPFMRAEDEDVAAEMAKHNVAAKEAVIDMTDLTMR